MMRRARSRPSNSLYACSFAWLVGAARPCSWNHDPRMYFLSRSVVGIARICRIASRVRRAVTIASRTKFMVVLVLVTRARGERPVHAVAAHPLTPKEIALNGPPDDCQ